MIDTAEAEVLKPFARQVLEVNSLAYVSLDVVEKYRFSRVIQIHSDDHRTSSTIFVEIRRNSDFYQKRTAPKVVTRVSHSKMNPLIFH